MTSTLIYFTVFSTHSIYRLSCEPQKHRFDIVPLGLLASAEHIRQLPRVLKHEETFLANFV